MDRFDFSELAAVSQQSLFGTYHQPSSILKRQQIYPPPSFSTPVYNSIEDWSAAELTGTDSAPSPGSGSPISPVFNGLSFEEDDWTSGWDKLEQSPESDLFPKSEFLDSPNLTSIPTSNLSFTSMDLANTARLDDVVFGREGVNDTRPLFQSPSLNVNMDSTQAQARRASDIKLKSTATSNTTEQYSTASTKPQQERRYPARNSLKRKCSDAESSSLASPRSSCSPPPPQRRHISSAPKDEPSSAKPLGALGPKKTAHNMIEKRYRTNLNDKIAALRDAVPALRVIVHRLEHTDEDPNSSKNNTDVMDEIKAEAGLDVEDDLSAAGLTPAHKLNKATILSKATEYIAHLERKNRALAKENVALKNRVEGFEMLVVSRSGEPRSMWS